MRLVFAEFDRAMIVEPRQCRLHSYKTSFKFSSHVRFGSNSDLRLRLHEVCSSPTSGHRDSSSVGPLCDSLGSAQSPFIPRSRHSSMEPGVAVGQKWGWACAAF